MPPLLKKVWDKGLAYWTGRTTSQRILLGGLAASVLLAFLLMVFWLNRPDFRVLYTKLYPEDAAKVVAMLQAAKEPYELQDNGQTILVPAERVYDLRLKIAGEGALHGQG
ncbi:MAG: flagellar M-ring protein FliF, partial [Desulfovibrionaceae bacterium]|nr:flagellar M-ring protein FliF [Desulfovibrionaceae bacterium]